MHSLNKILFLSNLYLTNFFFAFCYVTHMHNADYVHLLLFTEGMIIKYTCTCLTYKINITIVDLGVH